MSNNCVINKVMSLILYYYIISLTSHFKLCNNCCRKTINQLFQKKLIVFTALFSITICTLYHYRTLQNYSFMNYYCSYLLHATSILCALPDLQLLSRDEWSLRHCHDNCKFSRVGHRATAS